MEMLPDFAALSLHTPNLLLRCPIEADVSALVAGLGLFRVAKMLAQVPHPYREADAVAWLKLVRVAAAERSDLPMAIVHAGRVIGGIGLHGLESLPEVTNFGYWLAPPYWNRGFATEAARAVIDFAFDHLGADSIRSGVFIGNHASLRVQTKLGFEEIGLRSVFCLARGTEVPHIDTMLIRARYPAARQ